VHLHVGLLWLCASPPSSSCPSPIADTDVDFCLPACYQCDKCLCDEEEDTLARPPQNVPSDQVVSLLGDGAKSSCCVVKPESVEIDLSPSPPTAFPSSAPAPPKRSSCCAPAPPVTVAPAPPPTKKSCCAPASLTASSTPAAESSRAAPSTNGKSKAKCGSGGCGKVASAAVGQQPVRLRRLLPKPSATGLASLPSTNPPPNSSLSTNAPVVKELQQAPGSDPLFTPPLDPNSPNFLTNLFGVAAIPSPDTLAGQFDQSQQPFDPSMPTISDAELDEIMAALATNGGSLEDVLGGFGGGEDFSSGQVDLGFWPGHPALLDVGQQPLLDSSQAAAVLPADFDVSAFLNAFEPGGQPPVDPAAFNFSPPPHEQNLANLDSVLGSTSDFAAFDFDVAGQGAADVDWSLMFNPPTPS
jgi:hypothetical protein